MNIEFFIMLYQLGAATILPAIKNTFY